MSCEKYGIKGGIIVYRLVSVIKSLMPQTDPFTVQMYSAGEDSENLKKMFNRRSELEQSISFPERVGHLSHVSICEELVRLDENICNMLGRKLR